MAAIISVQHLVKDFRLGEIPVHVLKGISFDIERGDFVAIMGPSGSGKSTLMNILGCLDTPTSGTYTLDGIKRLVVHYRSGEGRPGRNARPWTAVWLSPYMTDRDPAQTFPATPSVWYREVIVDDKPIPPPA